MAKVISPLHRDFYHFPTNQFLRWKDWNCLYDFIYHCQGEKFGRHNLMLHIDCLRAHILKLFRDGKIKFFESERTRDRYINSIQLKQFKLKSKKWKKLNT